jgi:hypothetical protein
MEKKTFYQLLVAGDYFNVKEEDWKFSEGNLLLDVLWGGFG